MNITKNIPNLQISEQAKQIAKSLILANAIPSNSKEDALHIGIATAHGAKFLLTWNFKHINNAVKKVTIQRILTY